MPPNKDDLAYVWDMIESGKAVQSFVKGRYYSEYVKDNFLRSAVERQIEIIGEAARRISKEFRDQYPNLPWRRIIAQRNVLAHEYGEIRHEWIWRIATELVADMIAYLEPLLQHEHE